MTEQKQQAILTPEHPRWREFADRLVGPEGCNFHEDESGRLRWTCAGGRDQSLARAILERMSAETPDAPIDVAGTLVYCYERGGHCDCEIIFNVDPGEDDEDEEE